MYAMNSWRRDRNVLRRTGRSTSEQRFLFRMEHLLPALQRARQGLLHEGIRLRSFLLTHWSPPWLPGLRWRVRDELRLDKPSCLLQPFLWRLGHPRCRVIGANPPDRLALLRHDQSAGAADS